MKLKTLREEVVQSGLDALARGVVHGTAGNMSIRDRRKRPDRDLPQRHPLPRR